MITSHQHNHGLIHHDQVPHQPEQVKLGIANAFNNYEKNQFFMEYGKLHTYPKNKILYSSGEKPDLIYYINHGEIKISRSTDDGKEITLALLGKGDTFGEAEAIRGEDRRNTATVKKDSIIYCVPRETLVDRMMIDHRLTSWMLNRITRKQLDTENLMVGLIFKNASAKVAGLLLDLAQNYGLKDDAGILIDYPITHQEIGNLIATTRETVSYAFMEFRQMGFIKTVKRRTMILDWEGLQVVADQ